MYPMYKESIASMKATVAFFGQYFLNHVQLVQGEFKKMEEAKATVDKVTTKMDEAEDSITLVGIYQKA